MLSFLELALARWQPKAEAKGISLDLSSPVVLPTLSIDPRRINQVIDNLLNNAIHYTPTEGNITLSAAQRSIEHAQGQWLVITVHDTGPGIASADLPHLFERFYRADLARQRHQGGRGLGLSIVKQLVELHQGRVWVKSQPGLGSQFFVALPVD